MQDLLQSGEFLIHAALDVVDEKQWTTPQVYVFLWTLTEPDHSGSTHFVCSFVSPRYLKTIDKFNDNQVTAYITPKTRIMMVHKQFPEEKIGELCKEVHELYLKVSSC